MIEIIVTGASGFVGQHLINELKNKSYDFLAVTRDTGDITSPNTWNKLAKSKVVIHLAARSFVPDSWNDISGFMQCNLAGTIEALNYCKENNAHLIYLSSYLYGAPRILPISEDAPLSVNNPYALTKKIAEETCKFYSDSFGTKVTILRPFNVYGSGQSEQFLIPYLVSQIKTQKEIHVKDLEPKRDYLYINDLVRAIFLAIQYEPLFDVFNIGSGTSYSVKDLISIIQYHSNKNLPVFSDSIRRKNEIMDTIADISKAKQQLNWEPIWSLTDGIKDLLDSQ